MQRVAVVRAAQLETHAPVHPLPLHPACLPRLQATLEVCGYVSISWVEGHAGRIKAADPVAVRPPRVPAVGKLQHLQAEL